MHHNFSQVMSPDMMNSIKNSIDKLNEKNYSIRARNVKLVLQAGDLWWSVEDEDIYPEIRSGDSVDAVERKRKAFRFQEQCLAEILLSIEEKYMPSLSTKKTPSDVSNALKDMQMSKSQASRYTLRTKLFELKKRSDQTIRSFVQDISEIENRLALCGHPLKEDDKLFALYRVICEEYEIIRTFLQNTLNTSFEDAISSWM